MSQHLSHFSTMTVEERDHLKRLLEDTAVQYFQTYGFSGLSHVGWFNIYGAIQDAIDGEWDKAKHHNQDAELERFLGSLQ